MDIGFVAQQTLVLHGRYGRDPGAMILGPMHVRRPSKTDHQKVHFFAGEQLDILL